MQSPLQRCAADEDVRNLTGSQASVVASGTTYRSPRTRRLQPNATCLRDIGARLVGRRRNNSRTTIAKLAAYAGIEHNVRTDGVAKHAAAPNAATDHSRQATD